MPEVDAIQAAIEGIRQQQPEKAAELEAYLIASLREALKEGKQ